MKSEHASEDCKIQLKRVQQLDLLFVSKDLNSAQPSSPETKIKK